MSHSLVSLGKHCIAVTGLTMLTVMPTAASALALSQSASLAGSLNTTSKQQSVKQQTVNVQQGLIANQANKDDQEARLDLNRAKNLARQAAEAVNGGLRVYRAEAAMHGPAKKSPYVEKDDSWTWTILGGPPGSTLDAIETVVTVYKGTREVVVNSITYKDAFTTFTNAYRVTFRGVSYNSDNTSTWRYYVEELPGAQDLNSWVLEIPECMEVVNANQSGDFVDPDPNTRMSGVKWQLGNGFDQDEFSVTTRGRWMVGTTTVAVQGPGSARGKLAGPFCSRF